MTHQTQIKNNEFIDIKNCSGDILSSRTESGEYGPELHYPVNIIFNDVLVSAVANNKKFISVNSQPKYFVFIKLNSTQKRQIETIINNVGKKINSETHLPFRNEDPLRMKANIVRTSYITDGDEKWTAIENPSLHTGVICDVCVNIIDVWAFKEKCGVKMVVEKIIKK